MNKPSILTLFRRIIGLTYNLLQNKSRVLVLSDSLVLPIEADQFWRGEYHCRLEAGWSRTCWRPTAGCTQHGTFPRSTKARARAVIRSVHGQIFWQYLEKNKSLKNALNVSNSFAYVILIGWTKCWFITQKSIENYEQKFLFFLVS